MKSIILFLIPFCFLLGSCKKDQIAPADQDDAFVKFYGHVLNQEAGDMIQTYDGGYLLLGSSNSFNNSGFGDLLLIKTDSLGNEEWSKTFGDDGGDFEEQGVKIVPLIDSSGYVLAGNRIAVESTPSGQATLGQSHIVLYQVDLEGNPSGFEEVILYEQGLGAESDLVSDMMPLDDGNFILVGKTTAVYTGKNGYSQFVAYDKQDALIMKVSADGIATDRTVRGFVGVDEAVSIEVLSNYYIVTVTGNERAEGSNASNPNFSQKISLYIFSVGTLQEIGQLDYGAEEFGLSSDLFLNVGGSCYDPETGQITILANVTDQETVVDAYEGELLILRVTDGLQYIDHALLGFASGNLSNITANCHAGDITLVPSEEDGVAAGYIFTATHDKLLSGTENILVKLDANMQTEWPEARIFGRSEVGAGGQALTQNRAKNVIQIRKTVTGTTRSEPIGYAFTGTFDVGTNPVIGLVKTNTQGTLTIEE